MITMGHKQNIYADLRDNKISRMDAIAMLVELRWFLDDAEREVEDWQYQIDMQKDDDEERANGWCVGNWSDGI